MIMDFEDLTNQLGKLYFPHAAIVVYKRETEREIYVESYDFDRNGYPVNARPLTVNRAAALAKALDLQATGSRAFLSPSGLLPCNLLHIDPAGEGSATWYMPPQKVYLTFSERLGIPSGHAFAPALVFKASAKSLYVFALKNAKRPTLETALYKAPFFNCYADGSVCMGTVRLEAGKQTSLEGFISRWQRDFFLSRFSHLIGDASPIRGDMVNLWERQVVTGKPFPAQMLVKSGQTLNDILKWRT